MEQVPGSIPEDRVTRTACYHYRRLRHQYHRRELEMQQKKLKLELKMQQKVEQVPGSIPEGRRRELPL